MSARTAVRLLDGRFLPASLAGVPLDDRGLNYGEGLFETLRLYGGRAFEAEAHFARLSRGAKTLGIRLPFGAREFRRFVEALGRKNGAPSARVRFTVTAGSGEEGPARTFAVLEPYDSKDPFARECADGVRAILSSVRRPAWDLWRVKSLNYLSSRIAWREARRAGAFEGLLLSPEGFLLEGSRTNLFLAGRGRGGAKALLEPDPALGLLPGVTAALVRSLARRLGLRVERARIRREDLFRASEAFLTNSVAEIVPLVRVGARRVGAGRPGPATRALQAAYRSAVARACGGK